MPTECALTGLRVLELCDSPAGAWCGKILADLGADVVKVGEPDDSAYSFYLSTGKSFLPVNYATDDGRRRIGELLHAVDILVDDFNAERRASILGDTPSSLVWCSITPFGLTGPYASFKGKHLNIFHAGGEGYITPTGQGWTLFPDRPPLQFGGGVEDFDAGANAAIAILAAARENLRSHKGHRIDVSAQESELTLNRTRLSRYNYDGIVMHRAPLPRDIGGMLRCSDGWIQMIGWQDEVWRKFSESPDGASFADERFVTNQSRAANADLLHERLFAWCGERTRREAVTALAPHGFAVGQYSTPQDIAASEQLAHRSFFQTVEHPKKGPVTLPGVPYRFSATPVRLRPPSRLDESYAAAPTGKHESILPASSEQRRQPLEGLRILDFTWAGAGPYATLMLGLLGAEVIKVESSKRPDTARRGFLADYGGINKSPNFNELNLNKRSLQVDLTNPKGLELVKRLVPLCDMVVDNFRPGVMTRFGLDAHSLLPQYPSLIVASSSSNGSTGPDAMNAGLAGIFSAAGGLSGQTGYSDGPPTEVGESMDYRSGNAFTVALLAALMHRDRTGEGQFIDLSSTEVAVAAAPRAVLAQLFGLPVPGRLGNRHLQHAPHNVYPAAGKDAWISIAVTTQQEWQSLCALIDQLGWVDHYPDAAARKADEDVIDGKIEQWTRDLEAHAAFLILQEHGIPAAPSFSNKELASDPHLAARGVFVDVAHPVLGTHRVMCAPWRFADESVCAIRRHGPLLGQDKDYILGEVLQLLSAESAQFEGALC